MPRLSTLPLLIASSIAAWIAEIWLLIVTSLSSVALRSSSTCWVMVSARFSRRAGSGSIARGHMVKLDRDGRVTGTYPFGCDTTPAIYEHDGTYSIVIK